MTTSITATNSASIADALFTKLDTKQKGYIDEADLKNAAEATGTDATKTAEVFKQLDSDSDGKVTKSELSAAVEKLGSQLNAQLDQSRVDNATDGATTSVASPRPRSGGGGAPPAKSADSDSTTANKYIAAADTNVDGTVSADEAAAYKKMLSNAEAKAQTQAQAYKNTSEMSEQTTSSTFAVSA
jgi:hypothetical protein